jgi:hypothetical protein
MSKEMSKIARHLVGERNKPFGQKSKFAFEERVRASFRARNRPSSLWLDPSDSVAFGSASRARFAFGQRVRPFPICVPQQLSYMSGNVTPWCKNRSGKNPNLRSRNAFGRAGNRPSSFFVWYNFSGTNSFSGTKAFGFAFGLRHPICVLT